MEGMRQPEMSLQSGWIPKFVVCHAVGADDVLRPMLLPSMVGELSTSGDSARAVATSE